MRILLPILAFVALALIARWWYVCRILGQCGSTPESQTIVTDRLQTLNFKNGSKTILSAYDHFAFDTGQVAPKLNANNGLFLDKVAQYLLKNPELLLNITGGSGLDEEGVDRGFLKTWVWLVPTPSGICCLNATWNPNALPSATTAEQAAFANNPSLLMCILRRKKWILSPWPILLKT